MENKTINRKDLIKIRDYKPEDLHFIMATCLKGAYYGEKPYFKDIPKAIWMENFRPLIEKLLQLSTTNVKIVCLSEDADVLLGYSISHTKVFDGTKVGVLDWIYVKSAWRNIGLGKMLLPPDIHAFTLRSTQGYAIAKEKFPNLIFNPFILI